MKVALVLCAVGLVSGAASAKKKTPAEIAAEEQAAAEAAAQAEQERQRALDEAAARAAEAAQAEAAAQQEAERKAREQAAAEALERARAAESARVEAKGLDARVRRMCDALAREIKRLPGDWRDQTFAVTPFSEIGPDVQAGQLGLVVSDLVVTNLARDHRLQMTERRAIKAALDEKALAQLGVTDGDQAVEVGRIAGARGIIIGEVSDLGTDFKLTTRLVDTESARVVVAEEATVPKAELVALSTDAVVLKSKEGALFRSLVAPGWGQVYNGDPVTGGLVGGTVALLGVTTAGLLGAGIVTHALYHTYDPTAATGKTYEQGISEMKTLQTAAGVLYVASATTLALTAVAWGTGVTEAYLSGVDVDSLDQALLRE